MSSLREMYAQAGASSLQKQKEQQEKLESLLPKTGGDRNPYHKIEDGKNFFRIYPAHMGSDYVWCMKAVSWIPAVVDDKQGGGKKETKVPVFNARVHGGLAKDPVEFYVYMAELLVRTKYNGYEMTAEEKKTHGSLDKIVSGLLWPIKNYKDGLGVSSSWVAYADKYTGSDSKASKGFGRIEVYSKIKDKFNSQAAAIEDTSSPAASDPFSGVDDGWMVNLQKTTFTEIINGVSKKNTDYTVAHIRQVPLTDADLDAYEKVEPLEKLFVNSYKRSDFNRAIEGLKIVEKTHKYGVLNHPEFLKFYADMDVILPENETQTAGKEDEGDEFDTMSKQELAVYCKENEIPILITKATGENEIRDTIREFNMSKAMPVAKEPTPAVVVDDDMPWDKEEKQADIPPATKEDKFAKYRK